MDVIGCMDGVTKKMNKKICKKQEARSNFMDAVNMNIFWMEK